MNQDRKLVGEVVRMLLDSGPLSKKDFAKHAGVSRPTLYRVLGGDDAVEQATLRRVEAGLSLPYDTLSFIALYDWRSLAEIGADAGLVRWARRKVTNEDAEGSGRNGQTRRTRPGAQGDSTDEGSAGAPAG